MLLIIILNFFALIKYYITMIINFTNLTFDHQKLFDILISLYLHLSKSNLYLLVTLKTFSIIPVVPILKQTFHRRKILGLIHIHNFFILYGIQVYGITYTPGFKISFILLYSLL